MAADGLSNRDYKISSNMELGIKYSIGSYSIIGHPLRNGEKPIGKIGENAIIRSHTVIYSGTQIGSNFQTGHGVLIRENCVIGDNVSIGSHSVIEDSVIIEDGVRIHSNCFIPQNTIIKKNAWIGPSVTMVNDPHPPCAECMKGPLIGENAIIGANVTILDHIIIESNSLIGAGTVIVKNVENSTVVKSNINYSINSIKDLKCSENIKDKPYKNDCE